eukprot:snap_masked-scaffold_14-processed-gene-10.39-mRNA-1 protein AED:0.16 eAED:0.54 QI:0/-1/0/1/-1/1/1/0/971
MFNLFGSNAKKQVDEPEQISKVAKVEPMTKDLRTPARLPRKVPRKEAPIFSTRPSKGGSFSAFAEMPSKSPVKSKSANRKKKKKIKSPSYPSKVPQRFESYPTKEAMIELEDIPLSFSPVAEKMENNVLQNLADKDHDKEIFDRIAEAVRTNATAPFSRSKLMVVGVGRAGKSSTIKRLLGQPFDSEEPSTRGCDLKLSNVTHSHKGTWGEALHDEDHFVSHLQGAINKSKRIETNQGVGGSEGKKEIDLDEGEIINYGERFLRAKAVGGEEGEEGRKLGFTIWDFGGQTIFYSLHHLFLTEYGCYLVVFNANLVLIDENGSRKTEIEYLKFWLNSKKLHAPKAPLLLVGTHCSGFKAEDVELVNEVIEEEVLKEFDFNETRFEDNQGMISEGLSASFFPIDNASNLGVDLLRKAVEDVVLGEEYINEEVKISYLRALDLLTGLGKNYIEISAAKNLLEKNGLVGDEFEKAMVFLNERGLITYFHQLDTLTNYVVIQPQWLINGITDIIYDKEHHQKPKFDSKFNSAFRAYTRTGVISDALMSNIWSKKKYSSPVQKFFKKVMILTSLMCNYHFDSIDSYLIPTFPDIAGVKKKENPSPEYSGPHFVIDFSGDHEDRGDFVRYLPFGVFERLLCLVVEHSAHFSESMVPELKGQLCRLSFGTDVVFELQVAENVQKEKLWVLVRTFEDTSFEEARELIKQLYSMVEALKKDFFIKGHESESGLSVKLLLPSSEESHHVLASYEVINRKRATQQTKKFRPSKSSPKTVLPKDYDHWFQADLAAAEDSTQNNLLNPQVLNKQQSLAATLSTSSSARSLPAGTHHHCFLSYRQEDSLDLVGKLYLQLQNIGYKCWYDQQFTGTGGLTGPAMKEGVENCMIYVLILSKNIFKSAYVAMEVETAIQAGKKIMFLHHPDTNSIGYVPFGHYIETAPEIVKPLFASVESLQIRRRYYEEIGFLKEVERRIEAVRVEQM